MGARLWEALRDVPGVFGLYWDGKDLAVRVLPEADRRTIQSQVQFVLGGEVRLRSPVAGLQWWKLGPLSEAELWQAKDLIAATGLKLARDELRQTRMGPFRFAVFFPATGAVERTSFDDGSWNTSEARLTPAEPPPRRKSPSGPTLPTQSTWGGPRANTNVLAAPASSAFPAPAALSTPSVWPPLPAPSPALTPLTTAVDPPAGSGSRRNPRNRRGPAWPAVDMVGVRNGPQATVVAMPGMASSAMLPAGVNDQLALMTAELTRMSQELREMRRENAMLRQQVEKLRGLQQHDPYGLPPSTTTAESTTTEQQFPSTRTRGVGDLSPPHGVPQSGDGDSVMASPGMEADPKRARRSLQGVLMGADTSRPDPSVAGAPPCSDR